MLDQKYINYVKLKLNSGETRESITKMLLENNWMQEQVDHVFREYDKHQKIEDQQKKAAAKSAKIYSKVPPPKKSQVKQDDLTQVHAYVIPTERSNTGKNFFKIVIWVIVILIIAGGGYHLYTTEDVLQRIFDELSFLIERYTPIDIPYFDGE